LHKSPYSQQTVVPTEAFSLDPIEDQRDRITMDNNKPYKETASDELLRWHIRCCHVSMHRLQRMAARGLLPIRLARCLIPTCQACLYGKQTRRPWRNNVERNSLRKGNERPGDIIAVDQIISPTPGTTKRNANKRSLQRCYCIFVDVSSSYAYVHLQRTASSDDTLMAKQEFERFSTTCGVQIQSCHADNGRFIDNKWVRDTQQKGQTMRYAAAYAHHQNGIAEKMIRGLQDLARSSLLHAQRAWPDAIHPSLWPYALRKAAQDPNNIARVDEELSAYQKFNSSTIHKK
jgi:GAG-pre-integrase domain